MSPLSLPKSDAILVSEALKDEPQAFEGLVFRYQRKAYGLASALAANTSRKEQKPYNFKKGSWDVWVLCLSNMSPCCSALQTAW